MNTFLAGGASSLALYARLAYARERDERACDRVLWLV